MGNQTPIFYLKCLFSLSGPLTSYTILILKTQWYLLVGLLKVTLNFVWMMFLCLSVPLSFCSSVLLFLCLSVPLSFCSSVFLFSCLHFNNCHVNICLIIKIKLNDFHFKLYTHAHIF